MVRNDKLSEIIGGIRGDGGGLEKLAGLEKAKECQEKTYYRCDGDDYDDDDYGVGG